MKMGIYEKLSAIQQELKAPKGQFNSFGKYKYRSCEDILEAVKPIYGKYKTALVLLDDIKEVSGRFYVMAQAQLHDCESDGAVTATAYAREPVEKKGMDDSQITGTASSYARKYALNGLFCIDDTKDADTDEYQKQQEGKTAKSEPAKAAIPPKQKPGYKLPPQGDATVICDRCGGQVMDYFDGRATIKAARLAARAKQLYGYALCEKCVAAAKDANDGAG
jgi:hypothetical protein